MSDDCVPFGRKETAITTRKFLPSEWRAAGSSQRGTLAGVMPPIVIASSAQAWASLMGERAPAQ